ncbi:hypothetical protein FRB95_002718 [Tulasnella sp. JGI-2019a]|nr:hypothetical protein FRB95_002718 [Tulasnella sp. JGI-2019a]
MLFEHDFNIDLWVATSDATLPLQNTNFLPLNFDEPVAIGEGNMLGLSGVEAYPIDHSAWSSCLALPMGVEDHSTNPFGVGTAMTSQTIADSAPQDDAIRIPSSTSTLVASPPSSDSTPPLFPPNPDCNAFALPMPMGYAATTNLSWVVDGDGVAGQPLPDMLFPQQPGITSSDTGPVEGVSAFGSHFLGSYGLISQGEIDELLAILNADIPKVSPPPSPAQAKNSIPDPISQIIPTMHTVTPLTPERPASDARTAPVLPPSSCTVTKAEVEVVDLTQSPSPPPAMSFPSPSKSTAGSGSRPDFRMATLLTKRRPIPPGTPAASPRKRKAQTIEDDAVDELEESPTKKKKPSEDPYPSVPAVTVSMTPNGKGRPPAFDLSRKVVQAFKAQKAERLSKDVAFLSGPVSLKFEREKFKSTSKAAGTGAASMMESNLEKDAEVFKIDTSVAAQGMATNAATTMGSGDVLGAYAGVEALRVDAGNFNFNFDLDFMGLVAPPMSATTSTSTSSSDGEQATSDDNRLLQPPLPVLNDDWLLQLLSTSSMATYPSGDGSSNATASWGGGAGGLEGPVIIGGSLNLGEVFGPQGGNCVSFVAPDPDSESHGMIYGDCGQGQPMFDFCGKGSITGSDTIPMDLSSWLMDC